ncbi:MAG TPA: VTT domain-containing protein [Acetobacteraceae bacterium]|nr:VTT domain-containing protein [Acetobacteraceae bacterium]
MLSLRRVVPFVLLLAAVAALWATGLASSLNWASLSHHQAMLSAWIAHHRLVAPVIYAALYALLTALSFPEAAVFTVAGGLLFGTVLGGTLAVIGATIGATVLFLAARSAFAAAMAARAGARLTRIRAELHRNGFNYLLAIRLIPLFPFWLVNLAAALAGMRLWSFGTATLLGIIPGTFVFASIGAGVGDVLAAGVQPDLALIFSPPILLPMVALGLLSLLPVAWRKRKGRDG